MTRRPIDRGRLAVALLALGALARGAPSAADDGEKVPLRSFERRRVSADFTAEGAATGDIDGDGAIDLVSGPYWWRGPDLAERHAYRPARAFDPKGYSDCFFVFTTDLDGDGWTDILEIGFPGKAAHWYENPGKEGLHGEWKRHLALDAVDNESPAYVDVTGDGEREIVCSRAGRFGYASPDTSDPRAPWKFVAVSEPMASPGGSEPSRLIGAFTHGLGVGDVDGDGRPDLLHQGGWLRQPRSLAGAPLWKHHAFDFAPGRGGAQMLVTDVDGDGDADVITSLDAHGWGLVWWEQVPGEGDAPGFRRHDIMGAKPEDSPYRVAVSQLHALALADVDDDGLPDIITGKRYWAHGGRDPGAKDGAALLWFALKRRPGGRVDWVPHPIDDDSGVGTQVTPCDVNGDGMIDVAVGNKKGTFLFTQKQRMVTRAEWLRAQPRRIATDGRPPEEAAAAMTVPPGFTVDLIAGEPDVHQPIALAIDARGRLWVAEAHSYPRKQPEGQGKDRILIFEDADADGSFEKRTVFAEGLNLVSGLEVGYGGVFVGAAPHLLFIPDEDRDDKPDGEPRVLLDGWGYQDTHETLNGFQWGPDGWLYGCHGVFTHSRVGKPGTPDAERVPINAGFWRYHPVRETFEVFAWGTSNPWGIDFDERGEAFSTACVIPHLWHVMPGARYERQAGRHFDRHAYGEIGTIADHLHHAGSRWKPDHAEKADALGGGHAHCGTLVYLGDTFPASYRNKVFTFNIHGNRMNVDALAPNGSGFTGTHEPDFLLANDAWFRGISMRTGPDGAIYFIDWYDPRACHSPDPNVWDRSNGRIYRVRYGDVRPFDGDLAKLSSGELFALQERDNAWHARTARRILAERGPDPDVHARARTMIESKDERIALRGLWVLHVTGGEGVGKGLQSPHASVRAWAIRLLAERPMPDFSGATHSQILTDDSPLVRRAVASALPHYPRPWMAATELARRPENADDPNIPLLTWWGIEPRVAAEPEKALELAGASKIPLITRFIIRRLATDVANTPRVVAALAKASDDATRLLILEEMRAAFRGHARVPMPEGWDALYEQLTASADAAIARHARELAVIFGDRRVFSALRVRLADTKAPIEERRRALAVLREGHDPELAAVLVALLDDPPLLREALRALSEHDEPAIADAVLARWAGFGPEARRDAVATLAVRPASARALLAAIDAGAVEKTVIDAYAARQLRSLGDAKVDAWLAERWGTVRAAAADKAAEIARWRARLTDEALAAADRPRGRSVFARTCGSCHRLFDAGETVGPDLTGSNRLDVGYVLENVIDPSAVVGRDYRLEIVKTTGGRIVSGLVTDETDTALTVRTQTEAVVVPKAEIEGRRTDPSSMMPEGLLAGLSEEEVRDLVAYLGSPVQVPLPGRAAKVDEETGRVAGAIEGEALKVVRVGRGQTSVQPMAVFGRRAWSADAQLYWTGGRPGDRLELALPPVARAGRYEVDAVLTKARDYAIVRLALDGRALDAPIDLYDPRVVPTDPIRLGVFDLTAGEHRLSVEIVGANASAVRAYMVGLDFVRIHPVE